MSKKLVLNNLSVQLAVREYGLAVCYCSYITFLNSDVEQLFYFTVLCYQMGLLFEAGPERTVFI